MQQVLLKKTIVIVCFYFLCTSLLLAHNQSVNNSPASDSTKNSLPDTLVIPSVSLSSFSHYCIPVKGKVISKYGMRRGRRHTGTDIKLHMGDSVKAVFNGVVKKASTYYGYGILIVLHHDNDIETYYAHLSKALVNVGDTLLAGQVVGLGGHTGRATTAHLHFELRYKKQPYDPENIFDFSGNRLNSTHLFFADQKPPTPPSQNQALATKYTSVNVYHKIKRNDTLSALAIRYGTTVKHICALNKIKPTAILKIGQRIKIH